MILAMDRLPILLLAAFLCLPLGHTYSDGPYGCLPDGVELSEIVSRPVSQSEAESGKNITIGQTLARLKARCRKGKLVAANGREIYFYRLIGCWGNPPEDYQEQLAKQGRELQRLRKKFTVIEISCNQPQKPE
jgi:hypothetical protein